MFNEVIIAYRVRGGELFEHISERERLSEEEAAAFMRQILQGVTHMHSNNIAHLDLKVILGIFIGIFYVFLKKKREW